MRSCLFILFCLLLNGQVSGQVRKGVWTILTIEETLDSNGSVRTHHFASNDTKIKSAHQFHRLYFDKKIDYIAQNTCQNGDTLLWIDLLTVWGMSIINDFDNLEAIVNNSKVFIKEFRTTASTLKVYVTSVVGQFCRCFVNDRRIQPMYLPVDNFEPTTRTVKARLHDFDAFWYANKQ